MIATRRTLALITLGLSILFVLVLVMSILLGTAQIPFSDFYDILTGRLSNGAAYSIVVQIRLPRILMAASVGGALSICGVVMQSILRNPLAEPFVLGLSGGAAVGAILFILLGLSMAGGSFLFSFAGAILSLFVVLVLSKRKGGFSTTRIILTGVIVNAFFTAFIMFVITTTSDELLHAILFWLYRIALLTELNIRIPTNPQIWLALRFLPVRLRCPTSTRPVLICLTIYTLLAGSMVT